MRSPRSRCQVDDVIRRALADAAEVARERRVHVDLDLRCTTGLTTHEPVLEQSLYTLFRGLPSRVAEGTTLRVSTRDRAGGDIELAWEAEEVTRPANEEKPLSSDPLYGDLLELAIAGLEAICRARSGHMTVDAARRRYFFLIPSLAREPRWSPTRG